MRQRGKLNLKELAAPIAALTDPMRYDMARKDLEQQLSDDSKGWKILRCMFAAMVRTYEHYQKAGISEQTFADTMKCFPRFVREHKECFGDYGSDRHLAGPSALNAAVPARCTGV